MKQTVEAKSLFQQLVSYILLHNASKNITKIEAEQITLMILEYYLGIGRNDILLNNILCLKAQDNTKINNAVQRIVRDEPVQYVLGEADFYGYKLRVNPSVLIPRRETEELVQLIIQENTAAHPKIVDIGTGSGCIAITLKKKIPGAEVHGWDISSDALTVATQNARQQQVEIITEPTDILSVTFTIEKGPFDIIVSNPPYVRESETAAMDNNVLLYEPAHALFVPDENPLIFYQRISGLCRYANLLKKDGKLYFEVNEVFAKDVAEILEYNGFASVSIVQDMQKKDRFVSGTLSP